MKNEKLEVEFKEYSKQNKMCEGRITIGHWKGYPCGNIAKHIVNGKFCCYAHINQFIKNQQEEKNNE